MRAARRGIVAALAVLILLALPGLRASAVDQKPDPLAYGPAEKVEGKNLAEWSAAWWQWVLAIKKDRNPVADKTGEFAHQGQAGPVFMLAGNAGGKSERACKVPAGKPILVAVLNNIENAPPDKADEKKLRANAVKTMDRAADVELTLDGKPIEMKSRRVASAVFQVTGPEKPQDALFEDAAGKQVAASDGFWVILKPLAPGEHTLRFKGRLKSEKKEERFELEVTYRLTVVKE